MTPLSVETKHVLVQEYIKNSLTVTEYEDFQEVTTKSTSSLSSSSSEVSSDVNKEVQHYHHQSRAILVLINVILMIFTFLLFSTFYLSLTYDKYLRPHIDLMEYSNENRTRDLSYYHRNCPAGGITTQNVDDLYIDQSYTIDESVEQVMVHGMSVFPNLLSQETANSLRKYILEQNGRLNHKNTIGVIENENRWSFGIGANDDASVVKALKELTTNQQLRPVIERLIGENPAVTELTAITAGYGAIDQYWHPDIGSWGNSVKYARNFVPSFATFIALQNTTSEMGATGICPGTHMCSNEEASETCDGYGFQVSGENNLWKSGHGLLMNQQSFHRGAAHIDADAPHRVVFIVTFAPRPRDENDVRMLGQGGTYSLRWDMWGHTLNDLENASTAMRQPWTTLRALGLYKPKDADWGWDLVTQHSLRCANEEFGYRNAEEFLKMVTIPSWLMPTFEDEMSFQAFFEATLRRWKLLATIVCASSFALYLLYLLYLHDYLCEGYEKSIFQSIQDKNVIFKYIAVIVVYSGSIALFFHCIKHHLTRSKWAKSIDQRNLVFSPFEDVHSHEVNFPLAQREAVAIDEGDVLITDRFNSRFLSSLVSTMDYHPGNMDFKSSIKGVIETYLFLIQDDQSKLIDFIIDQIRKEDRNFAIQNDQGIWVATTLLETKKYIQNEIELKSTPLMKALTKEIGFLLSYCKYGRTKHSAMSKWTKFYLYEMIDTISENFGIVPFNAHRSPRSSYFKPKQRSRNAISTTSTDNSQSRSFTVQTISHMKRFPIKKNETKLFSISTSQLRNALYLQEKPHKTTYQNAFKEGDVVDSLFDADHNGWYKGVITEIIDGTFITVQYLDGVIGTEMESKNLKHFKQYLIGETVEIHYEGENILVDILQNSYFETILVQSKLDGSQFFVHESEMRRFHF